MDQDPVEQSGQATQAGLDQQPNIPADNNIVEANPVTAAAEPALESAPAAEPVNAEPATPETPVEPTEPATSAEPAESAAATIAEPSISQDNTAMLAAALNEPAATAPAQPLISSDKKSKKAKKAKASAKPDDAPAAKPGKAAKPAKTKPAAKATAGVKKSKAGFIIAIILLVILLLSGAGMAIWYFVYYNNPSVATLDAMNRTLHAQNIGLRGQIVYEPDQSTANTSVRSVTFDLATATHTVPNNVEVSMHVDFTDDPDLDLQLGLVQSDDNLIYLRVGGIMEAIEAANLDQEVQNEITTALDLAEEIDDEWWEISLVDLYKALYDDREQAKAVEGFYGCYVDAAQSDWTGEVAASFKEHNFIEVAKVNNIDTDGHWFSYQPEFGNSLYQLNFNKREMASFLNELTSGQTAEDFVDCYNGVMKTYQKSQGYSRYNGSGMLDLDDLSEYSAYDIDIPAEMNFYADISNFGHRLNRLLVTYAGDEESAGHLSVNLNFDYRKTIISSPDDYRPVTDLIDDDRLEDAFYELYTMPITSENRFLDRDALRNYAL